MREMNSKVSVKLYAFAVALAVAMQLAADTQTVNGVEWRYRINEGSAEILKSYYSKVVTPRTVTGALTIPSTLGGCAVTSIGEDSFADCTALTSVTIPNGVTNIGCRAFKGCSGLTSVSMPDSVEWIRKEAFSGCSGLLSILLPRNAAYIEFCAFTHCSNLESFVVAPENTKFKVLSGMLSVS